MSAPKLRKAMAELSQAIIDYPGDADLCDVCVAADQALTAYTNARAIKIARKDARRARKAARAKPAAGERAVVDAAAFDAAVEALAGAAAGHEYACRSLTRTEIRQAATELDAARAALRALVLGDGEGAP